MKRLQTIHLGTCFYNDVIMSTMASQITNFAIVYSIVCSSTDQRKHQSSASLAFVRGINRWPVNSLHKWPVTWKMFPLDDVIMFINIPIKRGAIYKGCSYSNIFIIGIHIKYVVTFYEFHLRRYGVICRIIRIYTTHAIVSWPNHKQWQMGHTSELMMIIR